MQDLDARRLMPELALSDLGTDTLMLIGTYLGLAGAYLLVIPFIVANFVDKRWTTSGGFEKILLFFAVFFFFPGIILVAPFINYRPKRRSI
ncbi:MAG: NAD(P)H-quinone oxidoreductase subunit L [Cyanobacteria bacterium P01_E01_bin.34]